MSFIGITGYERAGKDTAAAILNELLEEESEVIGLADAVRELCLEINPTILLTTGEHFPLVKILNMLGWEVAKDRIPAVRQIMQSVGSACRNVLGLDCFIRAARSKIYEAGASYKIIKDVRMDNEGRWCYRESDVLINIVRPGYGPVNAHESAQGQAVKYADITIQNRGTEEDLKAKLGWLVDKITTDPDYYRKLRTREFDK